MVVIGMICLGFTSPFTTCRRLSRSAGLGLRRQKTAVLKRFLQLSIQVAQVIDDAKLKYKRFFNQVVKKPAFLASGTIRH
jgi:hypothetical protein